MSSPAEHYQKADALMARVDEMKNPELRVSVALVAQAQVHALLAQCDFTWPNMKARMLGTRRATGDRL